MAKLDLHDFSGLLPRYNYTLSAQNYANIAHDVDLSGATLRPWRELKRVSDIATNGFMCGCTMTELQPCEISTAVTIGCQAHIISGVDKPRIALCDNQVCDPLYLGVSPPDLTLTATGEVQTNRSSASRTYVYTFVNALCQESAPSIPSNRITVENGSEVILTGFAAPTDGECVDSINIYREETGFRSGTEEVQEHQTEFFFIDTIPVGAAAYTDTVKSRNVGEGLATDHYYPPMDGIKGVRLVEGSNNILVGYSGKDIQFSTPNTIYAWEEKHVMSFPDSIRSIETGYMFTAVFTTSKVYIVLENGQCEGDGCREVIEHIFPVGSIVCCDGKGHINTPDGIVFNTVRGLMIVDNRSAPTLLLKDWMTEHEWRKMKPETLRLGFTLSNLFIITDQISYVYHMLNKENGRLTTISDTPSSMMTSPTGELIMFTDDGAYQWNAGNTLRPYVWENTYRTPSLNHFTTAYIEQSGLNDIRINDSKFMNIKDERFRCARYGKSRNSRVLITGIYELSRALLGSTIAESVR